MKEAKRDFEERDLVGDAFPLWTAPAGTIEGKHGLVRSLMLNDRQHVVTCDTAGGECSFLPRFSTRSNLSSSSFLTSSFFLPRSS